MEFHLGNQLVLNFFLYLMMTAIRALVIGECAMYPCQADSESVYSQRALCVRVCPA